MSSRRKRFSSKKKGKPYKPPKEEDLEGVVGRWKVTSVEFLPYNDQNSSDQPNITFPDYVGVELSMDDQCDVSWTLQKGAELIPLFQTTSFNIEKGSLDLFGGCEGRTFTFEVEDKGDGVLTLSTSVDSEEEEMNGCMTLTILKINQPPEVTLDSFTLQAALDERFFTDMVVTSCDNVSFNVHRTILAHCSPNMGYRDWEVFLASLKAPMAKIVLGYIYTHRLPASLSLSAVKELLVVVTTRLKLSHLSELCKVFIGSHDLKQRLIQLVDDLQMCLEVAKKMVDATDVTNPVKVTYTIKQLVKEAAVGAARFGLLCELYTRNKKDMTKPEKLEVLEYVRARVVVFIDLLCELIESALAKYVSLTEAQRLETATYIIPEVERVWDLINGTCGEVKSAMQSRLSSLKSKRGVTRPDIKISLLIQLIARGKETKRLHAIGKEFEDFLLTSSSKRDGFKDMSEADKVSKIIRAIEGLEKEGNTQRLQLQEAKSQILVDNALDWKKFKVLVALCCTYVSWGLRRVQHLKEPMLPTILKVCKFVQRSEFNEALLYFDLLTESDIRRLQDDDDDDLPQGAGLAGKLPSLAMSTVSNNELARGCYGLLGTDLLTDMEFILLSTPEGGVVGEPVGVADPSEGVVIRAHRVIVASRCEWFKRALLAGMKEAIDRRIVIRDCPEETFRLFLRYLYGGPLELNSLSIDDLIDLLAVADHYETSVLRGRCEECLVGRVEDSTVFPLLQVADRYSTRRLRESTLQYILNDPDVIMAEVDGYSGLHDDLKRELRALLSSPTDPHLLLRHTVPTNSQGPAQVNRSPSSSSDSSDDHNMTRGTPTSFQLDDSFHDSDTLEFQSCLEQLRGVVGEEASNDMLKEILMAADMDINRAINYYFNTQ